MQMIVSNRWELIASFWLAAVLVLNSQGVLTAQTVRDVVFASALRKARNEETESVARAKRHLTELEQSPSTRWLSEQSRRHALKEARRELREARRGSTAWLEHQTGLLIRGWALLLLACGVPVVGIVAHTPWGKRNSWLRSSVPAAVLLALLWGCAFVALLGRPIPPVAPWG